MTPGEVHGELAHEWSRNAVRRGQVRLLTPRLAELLDALATGEADAAALAYEHRQA
jgi:hypothetical protein